MNPSENDYGDYYDVTEECWACGGDGYYHNCGEDTCCCAEPDEDDLFPCEFCGGTGEM